MLVFSVKIEDSWQQWHSSGTLLTNINTLKQPESPECWLVINQFDPIIIARYLRCGQVWLAELQ